jgi:hypothetical protein
VMGRVLRHFMVMVGDGTHDASFEGCWDALGVIFKRWWAVKCVRHRLMPVVGDGTTRLASLVSMFNEKKVSTYLSAAGVGAPPPAAPRTSTPPGTQYPLLGSAVVRWCCGGEENVWWWCCW